MDTASSPIRRPVSSPRLRALLLAGVLLAACEPSTPRDTGPSSSSAPAAETTAPSEPEAASDDDQAPAPTEWPQEVALPEALSWDPEVFGKIVVHPGDGEHVCNLQLEVDPATPDVLHATLVPDGVENPIPDVNVRHDPPPPIGRSPWYRVGRQRYSILGHEGDTFEVYLDRTPWEAAIDESWPALAPGTTSTVWMSTAGRMQVGFGDVALSLVTDPEQRGKSDDAPYRWRVALQVAGGDDAPQTLSVPHDIGQDLELPDGHVVRIDELQLGRDHTLAEATGEVLTPTPVPTVHVRVTVRR